MTYSDFAGREIEDLEGDAMRRPYGDPGYDLDDANYDAWVAWTQAHDLTLTGRCRRCAGTGQFITYIENGVPKGPGGICYRCGGKGWQSVADTRRNYGHDNFAPIQIW
jgi:hypothetical protein